MKKHGFILNMKDDTLEVEDRKVELDTTVKMYLCSRFDL